MLVDFSTVRVQHLRSALTERFDVYLLRVTGSRDGILERYISLLVCVPVPRPFWAVRPAQPAGRSVLTQEPGLLRDVGQPAGSHFGGVATAQQIRRWAT